MNLLARPDQHPTKGATTAGGEGHTHVCNIPGFRIQVNLRCMGNVAEIARARSASQEIPFLFPIFPPQQTSKFFAPESRPFAPENLLLDATRQHSTTSPPLRDNKCDGEAAFRRQFVFSCGPLRSGDGIASLSAIGAGTLAQKIRGIRAIARPRHPPADAHHPH